MVSFAQLDRPHSTAILHAPFESQFCAVWQFDPFKRSFSPAVPECVEHHWVLSLLSGRPHGSVDEVGSTMEAVCTLVRHVSNLANSLRRNSAIQTAHECVPL